MFQKRMQTQIFYEVQRKHLEKFVSWTINQRYGVPTLSLEGKVDVADHIVVFRCP